MSLEDQPQSTQPAEEKKGLDRRELFGDVLPAAVGVYASVEAAKLYAAWELIGRRLKDMYLEKLPPTPDTYPTETNGPQDFEEVEIDRDFGYKLVFMQPLREFPQQDGTMKRRDAVDGILFLVTGRRMNKDHTQAMTGVVGIQSEYVFIPNDEGLIKEFKEQTQAQFTGGNTIEYTMTATPILGGADFTFPNSNEKPLHAPSVMQYVTITNPTLNRPQ